MVKNYILIAFRMLRRRGSYSLVNIFGLALGMVCCLCIAAYVQYQLSFDDHHERSDHIYRIALDATLGEHHLQSAMSAVPLAEAIQETLPEVKAATRLWRDRSGAMTVYSGDQQFPEERVVFADSNVFDVFTIPMTMGDPTTALTEPFTIVLTESMAEKYFGTGNPIGQRLSLREPSDRDLFDYTVTGVVKDLPATSHFSFDFLASYATQRWSRSSNWLGFGVYTYVELNSGAAIADVESKVADLVAERAGPQVVEEFGISYQEYAASGQGYRYFAQPLTEIHLRSSLDDEFSNNGNIVYVWAFSVIAIFVLLIACVNFINLTTARAAERAREVGVRKALGAARSKLIGQFLTESVITALLALIVSAGLVAIFLPYFNSLTGTVFQEQSSFTLLLLGMLAIGLGVGVISGSYPALYLASFRPASVLKTSRWSSQAPSRMRNALVVFQFVISIVLVAGTIVVYQQMDYMRSKNLGFNVDQVLVLEGAEILGRQAEAFRESVRALPGVASVTNSEVLPGDSFDGSMFRMEDDPADQVTALNFTYASFDFVETLGLELVDGRSLDRTRPGDSLGVILNETAVRQLGVDEPVGRRLVWPGESTYTIVGVVRDFHIESLHAPVVAVALLGPDPRNTNRPNLTVAARIVTENPVAVLNDVERTWNQFAPGQPFVYSFLDQQFAEMYESERVTGRLVAIFAVLALLIASIGLFGLTAFSAQRRTKEIGIRKVLGATVPQLTTLLSRDFLVLVGIGFVIAAPLAYFALDNWLETFAYRQAFGVLPIVAAGVFTLLIAMLTVGYQAVKTALSDPVTSLRYE